MEYIYFKLLFCILTTTAAAHMSYHSCYVLYVQWVDRVNPADRSSAILGEKVDDLNKYRFDMSPAPESGQAEIYIHTLSPFTGHGPGDYKMSVLKKTSSSGMFLDLADSKKKCQVEKREGCTVREWLANLRRRCNCIPYQLAAFKAEVAQSL